MVVVVMRERGRESTSARKRVLHVIFFGLLLLGRLGQQ